MNEANISGDSRWQPWPWGRSRPSRPKAAWQRPLGQGWENPFTGRSASNLDDGPWHGAPLGGFGAGCFGRSSRGDITLWHLDGGEHWFGAIPDCQFAIHERRGDDARTYALSTATPTDGSLSSWAWYPASQSSRVTGHYAARYPLSWFQYSNVFRARICCEQFSPIIPGDYQRTSYPVAVFRWLFRNPGLRPLQLSLLLSWRNLCGWFTNTRTSPEVFYREDGSPVYTYVPAIGRTEGQHCSFVDEGQLQGLLLHGPRSRPVAEGEGQWCLAVGQLPPGVELQRCGRWNPGGDGAEIWTPFSRDGSIPQTMDTRRSGVDDPSAVAMAVRFQLQPGATLALPLVISWDLPVTEFAQGITRQRRYTDFFGRSGDHAMAIAAEALRAWPQWRQAIDRWQEPILEQEDLSEAVRMALFNELGDLASGGSLWTAATADRPVGHFGVLECPDYSWYESLDVRLYGSLALVQLWPELDKAVLRDFARAIPSEDLRSRLIGWYITKGQEPVRAPRKRSQATPHDLGAPNEHPFTATNYTAYQDCNLWKDLPSDFVLQVWRTFRWGGQDLRFLADCWPAVDGCLRYLQAFDKDGDGLPDHGGAPDQTFDDWPMQGASAYCGGLWIAALEAALASAQQLSLHLGLDTTASQRDFGAWLQQARGAYDRLLWRGQHYAFDTRTEGDVVMADQLCGDFYARLLGLPSVVSEERARATMATICRVCFNGFHRGSYGVVNGLREDSSPVDPQGTHPLEIWTGINFGLAAYCCLLGDQKTAMAISGRVIEQIYDHGLQFRTPEAITADGSFRACHYLRPMAVWAIWAAHTRWKPLPMPKDY